MNKKTNKVLIRTGITLGVAITPLATTINVISTSNKSSELQRQEATPKKLTGNFRLNEHLAISLEQEGLEDSKYFLNPNIGGTKYKIDTDGQRIFTVISDKNETKGGVAAINEHDGKVLWYQEIPNFKNITGLKYDVATDKVIVGVFLLVAKDRHIEQNAGYAIDAKSGEITSKRGNIDCYNTTDWDYVTSGFSKTAGFLNPTHGKARIDHWLANKTKTPIVVAVPRIFGKDLPKNDRYSFGYAFAQYVGKDAPEFYGDGLYYGNAYNADRTDIGRGMLFDGFPDARLKGLDYANRGFDASLLVSQEGQVSIYLNRENINNKLRDIDLRVSQDIASNSDKMSDLARTMSAELAVDLQKEKTNDGSGGEYRYYVSHFVNTGDNNWSFVNFSTKYGYTDALDFSNYDDQIPIENDIKDIKITSLNQSGLDIDIENIIYSRNQDTDRVEYAYIYAKEADLGKGKIGPCILKYDMRNPQNVSEFGSADSFKSKDISSTSRISVYTTLKDVVKDANAEVALVGFNDGIIGAIETSTGNYFAISPINDNNQSQLAYDSKANDLAADLMLTNKKDVDAFALDLQNAQKIVDETEISGVNQVYVKVSKLYDPTNDAYNGKREVDLVVTKYNNGTKEESSAKKVTLNNMYVYNTKVVKADFDVDASWNEKYVNAVTKDELKNIITKNIATIMTDLPREIAPKAIPSDYVSIGDTTPNKTDGSISVSFNTSSYVDNGTLKNSESPAYTVKLTGFIQGEQPIQPEPPVPPQPEPPAPPQPPHPDPEPAPPTPAPGPDHVKPNPKPEQNQGNNSSISNGQLEEIINQGNKDPSKTHNQIKEDISNQIYENMKDKIENSPVGTYPQNVLDKFNPSKKDEIIDQLKGTVTLTPTDKKPITQVEIDHNKVNEIFGIEQGVNGTLSPNQGPNSSINDNQLGNIIDEANKNPSLTVNQIKDNVANKIYDNMKDKIQKAPEGTYPQNVLDKLKDSEKNKILQQLKDQAITVTPNNNSRPITDIKVNHNKVNEIFGITGTDFQGNPNVNPHNPNNQGNNSTITDGQIGDKVDQANKDPNAQSNHQQVVEQLKQQVAEQIFNNMKDKVQNAPAGTYPQIVHENLSDNKKQEIIEQIKNHAITIRPDENSFPITGVDIDHNKVNAILGIKPGTNGTLSPNQGPDTSISDQAIKDEMGNVNNDSNNQSNPVQAIAALKDRLANRIYNNMKDKIEKSPHGTYSKEVWDKLNPNQKQNIINQIKNQAIVITPEDKLPIEDIIIDHNKVNQIFGISSTFIGNQNLKPFGPGIEINNNTSETTKVYTYWWFWLIIGISILLILLLILLLFFKRNKKEVVKEKEYVTPPLRLQYAVKPIIKPEPVKKVVQVKTVTRTPIVVPNTGAYVPQGQIQPKRVVIQKPILPTEQKNAKSSKKFTYKRQR